MNLQAAMWCSGMLTALKTLGEESKHEFIVGIELVDVPLDNEDFKSVGAHSISESYTGCL